MLKLKLVQKSIIRFNSTKWEGKPKLPYINHQEYLKTLEDHINTTPLKKVLLVWGNKSVAKSWGIQLKEDEWKKEGHLVIDVDLKGFDPKYQFFTKLFEQKIFDAFKDFGIDVDIVKTVHEEIKNKDATSQELVKKYLQKKYWFSNISIDYSLFDNFGISVGLNTLFKLITSFQRGTPQDLENILSLIENLDSIDALKKESIWKRIWNRFKNAPPKSIRTILIIREIQSLDKLNEDPKLGVETMDRLIRFYQPRKQGRSKVPVIVETSDFLWSRIQQLSESRESFQDYRVQHFKKEDLYNILVLGKDSRIPEQIFTEEEFDIVWEHTGGHQGTLYELHDRLTSGQQLDNVISAQKSRIFSETREKIVDVVKGDKKAVIQNREDFLTELYHKNFVMDVKIPDDDEIILYFLQKNILFYDGENVFPQTKPIENALKKYLKLFVLKEKD
jgi:hypothetical protein